MQIQKDLTEKNLVQITNQESIALETKCKIKCKRFFNESLESEDEPKLLQKRTRRKTGEEWKQ